MFKNLKIESFLAQIVYNSGNPTSETFTLLITSSEFTIENYHPVCAYYATNISTNLATLLVLMGTEMVLSRKVAKE